MKRQWGRFYFPDKRDKRSLMPRKVTNITKKFWTSRWIGDQLDTPQCVGFAWAAWLDAPPIRQFLYPHGIYFTAQHFDEWQSNDYDGTSVRGAAKVLHSLGTISKYQWAFDIERVIDTVLTTGPVVIGVNWYQGMMETDKDHFVHVSGIPTGGHAVLVDGCDTKTEAFRVKNSWGRSWGKNGWCFLSFSDLARLLKEDGEACIGVEVRPRSS